MTDLKMTTDADRLPPLNVLVADDDVAAARALGRIVESGGHNVVLLHDARDAMRVVRDRSIDVVLADERMPGMTGSELLATLARLHPRTFRVLMSCALACDRVVDVVNHARVGYLLRKPFHIEEVRELLRFAEADRRIAGSVVAARSRPLEALRALNESCWAFAESDRIQRI